MKILLACQQSPHRYAIPAYGFWRTYFVEGLREAGHEVVEVVGADWARGLLPLAPAERARWLDQTWSQTLAAVRGMPELDLFLGYLYPQQIDRSALQALRRVGVPAVNFFCDNVREYRRLPDGFADFDAHWVPEHDALALYAARGWKAVFAPMPCWVPPACRQLAGEELRQVTFIGRRDALRADLLAGLARRGLPLAVHGPGWSGGPSPASEPLPAPQRPTWRARWADWSDFYRRQGLARTWRRLAPHRDDGGGTVAPDFDFSPFAGPATSDEDYARLLARSAVTLGINRYPDLLASDQRPPTYSRLRDVEAPMLGACYLTEWAPELPGLYDLDREIAVYRTAEELADQASRLLADPGRRQALRLAGQRRALAQHTVGASLTRLTQALGLAAKDRR